MVLPLKADRLVGFALFLADGGPVVGLALPEGLAALASEPQRGVQVVGVEACQIQTFEKSARVRDPHRV